ncbi:PRC-barrel domain-containing protein [Lichenifustis flavocetrariae]|uniref:PRC-barrel domain-containing protein n=1 Tax=Lichenifustis flavocetrariae TaxID=2949735 RepID=A0AA41Z2S7_9HYPH|nr:PRC-barrel domain-containing protein [Lichenifustis flavocetrariae]MCW6511760.1 PRC-barrel domain-containing protein [Lichenifustis flavocetrariae]
MKHIVLFSSIVGCLSLGLPDPTLAAEAIASSTAAATPAADQNNASAAKPADACLQDLRAFNAKIDKDGFQLGGAGYGYGYPAGGWGLGYGYDGYGMGGYRPPVGIGYQNARPGYEVRNLLASANILARQGQQQRCEDLLSTTNVIYNQYALDMRNGKSEMVDGKGWMRQQIDAAQPVTDKTSAMRSDELIGTELRNKKDEELGSVDDLILSPTTGKIAYLIIARGGIFGIDQNYVPVPWTDIKASPNMSILVLDSAKSTMDGAPQVKHNQFLTPEQYTAASQKVDGYWKTHLAAN